MHLHGGNALSSFEAEKLYKEEIINQNAHLLSNKRKSLESEEYVNKLNQEKKENISVDKKNQSEIEDFIF